MKFSVMIAKNQDGFTLVEIIVVTILMGIIAMFSALFIVTGISGYVSSVEHAALAQKAGLALARITVELTREMKSVIDTAPDESQKTYIKYTYRSNPAAYRHLSLVGTGSRKALVLVDRDTPVPDDSDDEVLVDNVSGFTLEFKKLGENGVESDWSEDTDAMDQLAKIMITLTLFVNQNDPDTVTFTTTITPPDFDDVITTWRWGSDPEEFISHA